MPAMMTGVHVFQYGRHARRLASRFRVAGRGWFTRGAATVVAACAGWASSRLGLEGTNKQGPLWKKTDIQTGR